MKKSKANYFIYCSSLHNRGYLSHTFMQEGKRYGVFRDSIYLHGAKHYSSYAKAEQAIKNMNLVNVKEVNLEIMWEI